MANDILLMIISYIITTNVLYFVLLDKLDDLDAYVLKHILHNPRYPSLFIIPAIYFVLPFIIWTNKATQFIREDF